MNQNVESVYRLDTDCQTIIKNMIHNERYILAHKLANKIYSDPVIEYEKWEHISLLVEIPTNYLVLMAKRTRDALHDLFDQRLYEISDKWYIDFEVLETYLLAYIRRKKKDFLS